LHATGFEPLHVQAFVSKPTVKPFGVSALSRFARLVMNELDTLLNAPGKEVFVKPFLGHCPCGYAPACLFGPCIRIGRSILVPRHALDLVLNQLPVPKSEM
jgi:hypothetical protein